MIIFLPFYYQQLLFFSPIGKKFSYWKNKTPIYTIIFK